MLASITTDDARCIIYKPIFAEICEKGSFSGLQNANGSLLLRFSCTREDFFRNATFVYNLASTEILSACVRPTDPSSRKDNARDLSSLFRKIVAVCVKNAG